MDDRTDALRLSTGGRIREAGRSNVNGNRSAMARGVGLAVLMVVELAVVAWVLILPLPNANNAIGVSDEPVRRGWLLLKALPEVVPGTTFRESILGAAALELSHVENLPQRLPVVLAAALIAAAAVGLGELVMAGLRFGLNLGGGERIALNYGLGAALLGVVTLLLGRAGWLNPWVARGGLAAIAVAGGLVARQRGWPAMTWPRWDWRLLLGAGLVGPFLMAMVLGSMLPSIDFDVLEYHVQGPKEYFQAGRISFLPHNVYTSMPFGIEMLHLLGMEVLGDWWWGALAGQLLVAFFAPAAAVLIASTACEAASSRAGWFAAVVYLTTPWIYRLAVIAYVEGPLCYYHAALVWGLTRLVVRAAMPAWTVWSVMGLLAGGAMGCKYPGLISAVIPFGFLALWDSVRRRSVIAVVAFSLGWAAVMGVWLGKNVIETGDPVYPLGYRVFEGRHWDDGMAAKWELAHGRKPVEFTALWDSIVDVAGRSDWQSPLYVALVPLALLRAGSRRFALALWGYAVYLFATWWLLTHRLDRFWLPVLPVLAVLAGLGADWVKSRAWTVFLATLFAITLLANLADISTVLTGLNEWTGDLVTLRKRVPEMLNRPLAKLDRELPAGEKVLLVGQAAVFHLNHPVEYNTVFNREKLEILAAGKSSAEFHRSLKDRGLTYVYVDWKEIERHRKPGGYGYSDFVAVDRFRQWVKDGVMWPAEAIGDQQELYRVRRENSDR